MIVRFVGPLATKLGKEIEVEIEKELSVREAIERIVQLYPQARDELSDLSFYNISVNGELLKKEELDESRVGNNDEIILIPAIAGGGKERKIKLIIKRNFDISTPSYDDFERKYRFFRKLADVFRGRIEGKALKILDVGCGTGILKEVFPESKVTGIDISSDMVRIARNRLSDALVGDAGALPFRDSSFDHAVFNAVIFLIPDGRNALKEAIRVVRDGGKVFGTYLIGLFENGTEVLEKIDLRHRIPFPYEMVEKAVKEFNGTTDHFSFRVERGFVIDFYSIPAMSNALFPKVETEERIKLARQKLSNLPEEMDFVWGIFEIPG